MKIIYELAKGANRLIYRNRFEKRYYVKATPWLANKAEIPSWQKAISRMKSLHPVGLGRIANLNLPIFPLKLKPSLAPLIIGLLIIIGIGALLIKLNPRTTPKIKAFDLTLSPAPTSSNYLYQNVTNGFKVYLGNRLEETKPKVKFEQDNSSAEFSLAQAPDQNARFKKEGSSSVVYQNVWPGIDVKYYLIEKGVKEEIIINSRDWISKNQEFKFNLNLKNAVPKKSLEGKASGYFVEPNQNQYVFHIPQPFMVDATGNRSEAVDLKIERHSVLDNNGGQSTYTITLVPNSQWLASAFYPVTIDPSVVHDESSEFTGEINRIEDEGSGTTPKLRTPYHELPADIHTVALWHMNETTIAYTQDSSGYDNHQTTGSTSNITTTNQRLGAAARTFDGSTNYLRIPDSNSLYNNTLTVEAWIKPDSACLASGKVSGIVDQRVTNNEWQLALSSGQVGWAAWKTGGDSSFNIWVSHLEADRWYHVAGTTDGATAKIFINGEEVASSAVSGITQNVSTALTIGKNADNEARYFSGLIDEVRISDVARTAEEIKQDAQRFPYGVYTSDTIDLNSATAKFISIDSIEWTDNVSTPGATLDGYPNFKPVIIDNTQNSSTLTDYQVKVDVNYDSNMQSDFDDLRFTSRSQNVSSYGNEAEFNQANTSWTSISPLDSTHFVVVYEDTVGDLYGCAKIGTISGTSITYGNEYCFNEYTTYYTDVAVLDSTHFVVTYLDGDVLGDDLGCAKVGTISGSTISYGNESCFTDDNPLSTPAVEYVSVAVLSSTKFVVGFRYYDLDGYGHARVGTVSGTSISYGSDTTFNSDTTLYVSVDALDSTHFIVGYYDSSDDDGHARVGTVSGTSISYGSVYTFNSANTDYVSVAALNLTHFVVSYRDDGGSNYGCSKIGTISGTTISYGSENCFNEADTWYISNTALDSTHFVVGYQDTGGDTYGHAKVGLVSGSTIIYDSESTFNSANSDFISASAQDLTHFVIGYRDNGGADYGCTKLGTVANINLDYWIEEKSDGVEADVWVEVDTIPASSLTTIWMWYGNGGASAASNGDNTFYFLDDFNDGSIDTNKWTTSGTVTESGGWAHLNRNGGVDAKLYTKNAWTSLSGLVVKLKTKLPNSPTYRARFYLSSAADTPIGLTSGDYGLYYDGANAPFEVYFGGWSDTMLANNTNYDLNYFVTGTNLNWVIKETDTGTNKYINNGTLTASATSVRYFTFRGDENDNSDSDIDYIYVRSYSSPEPITGVGADVEFQTRTSSDGSTWEAWKPTTNETSIFDADDEHLYNTTDSGLVSYYPLNELSDNTCSGGEDTCDAKTTNHGTATGTDIVDGVFGKARGFDNGSSDLIDFGDVDFLSKISIEAWIHPNSYVSPTNNRGIISKRTATEQSGNWDMQIIAGTGVNAGRMFWRVWLNSTTSQSFTSNAYLAMKQWHHIVVTFDETNDTAKIYINGKLDNTVTNHTYNLEDNAETIQLGSGGQSSTYFDGMIDEVRLYDDILPADTIAKHAAEGVERLGLGPGSLQLSPDSTIKMEGDRSWIATTSAALIGGQNETRGLWHLEETAGTGSYIKDESNLGNDLSVSGTVNLVDGISGQARDFDGSSGYLSCTDANCGGTTKLDYPGSGGWSFGAWVKLDTLDNGDDQVIISKYYYTSPSDNGGYILYFDDTNDVFSACSANNSTACTYFRIASIETDTWYHLVMSADGSEYYLYLNGQVNELNDMSTGPKDVTQAFSIGADAADESNDYFNGIIDEPFVLARELSAKEVAQMYQRGKDQRLNRTISSTDLSGKTKLPFYFAADKQGTIAETYIAEANPSAYLVDENTVGLWHLDDQVRAVNYLYDDFEYDTSLGYGWTCTGVCGVSTDCAQKGSNAAYVRGYVTDSDVASDTFDLSKERDGNLSISYWVRKGDTGCGSYPPETGEDLYVQYLNSSSFWTNIEQIQASALSDGEVKVSTYALASDAYHSGFRVRFVTNATGNQDYWHFDSVQIGKLEDASPYNNHGIPFETGIAQGKIGGARYFDGSDDYIMVGDNDSLDFSTGTAFTTEAWVKMTGTSKATQRFVTTGTGAGGDGMWTLHYNATPDAVRMNIGPGDSTYCQIDGTTDIEDGQWHHVAAVVNRNASCTTSDILIYIDGAQETTSVTLSSANTNVNLTNNDPEYFGVSDSASGLSDYLEGYLDEVRISDVVRTADEIRLAYQYGLRAHQINVDFKAKLDSGNLITGSGDTSFTIDATNYGAEDKGDNLYVYDKVIVKENYNGTNYIAQGDVTAVTASTGAVTVDAWDTGSTFPGSGYTVNATVFKWQREYWDLNDISPNDRNAIITLGLRVIEGGEGATMYLDDFKSNTNYLTDNSGSTITSTSNRYIQYRAVLSTNNTEVTPELNSVTIDYTENNRPNTPTLDSPSDTATDQSVTPDLKTTTTDDESDYLKYKIELCENEAMTTNCQTFDQTDSQTGWSGQDAQGGTAYASGTQATYTVQSSLSLNFTYYWRSYAIDPGGSEIWSATQGTPYSFSTNYTPTAPTDLLTEGQTNPSGVTDTTPEFSAVYNDPDPSDIANKYRIQVDDDQGFGSTIWDSGAAGSSMSDCTQGNRCQEISYGGASTDLQWGAKYYWRIKYWDDGGLEGVWSTEEAYFIMDVFKAPTGCHMDDGSQPGQITIKWQDNDDKETGFRIEKEIDGGGFALLTTEAVDSTSYLDNTTSVDHTYQYRIRGNSNNGNTTWCGTTKADFSEGNFKFEGIRMEGLTID